MKNRKNIANFVTSPNYPQDPSIVGSIHQIPSYKIHPMPSSPFKIRQDTSLSELVESVRQFGILVPTEVRPMKNGDYGLTTFPTAALLRNGTPQGKRHGESPERGLKIPEMVLQ